MPRAYEPQTHDWFEDHCKGGVGPYTLAPTTETCSARSQATLSQSLPVAESYARAALVVAENELQNVQLFRSALGAKQDRADICVQIQARHNEPDLNAGASFVPESYTKQEAHIDGTCTRRQTVQVVAADTIVLPDWPQRVSCVHLDIERFEPEALQGMKNILSLHSPVGPLIEQPP